MLRCNSDGSSLDSIKLVSDNLSERVKLDCSNNDEFYGNEDGVLTSVKVKSEVKNHSKPVEDWSASLRLLEVKSLSAVDRNSDKGASMTDMSMNSNLMFRSMFFMNDEATRHFLAPPLPPIQPCDIQSDYFQKKLSQVSSSSTPGSSSVTTSSTNTGNISASTTNTNTTGTTTTGTNTPNPSNQLTTSSVGVGVTPENKLTITLPKQRPHTCEECGKTFLMKHHLLTHMRVHTGERPYICPECGKSFALKHCLSTHLLLHTADRPYKCNECNKSFTLKHHLVSHERVHTRDRPFECTECGQRFPQKRHLSTHIKFHSGERPFSCQVCGESFSREEHLVMHSRFHGGLSPYNCPDCGAGFLRKFELVNHERQHGRNPESCPNCGKEFLQKRTLLVHMRSCNGNGPISLATTQQSFSPPRFSESGSPPRFSDNSPPRFNDGMTQRFPNNSNSPRYSENSSNQFRFSEGQMRFNNDNTPSSSPMPPMQAPKDKVCKECGETFASVEGLALHLRLHFGDHSFLADICSLAASLKQTAVNVAASLKKTHICTDCGRGFTQRHGLFQHRQRHANGSCKEKPFACEKCGKSFAQKNHLMLHERQHMDLPPRNSKNSQKVPQPRSDNVEQMDTSSETGHQIDRTLQDSEISMQNHPDHQRVDMLNRHPSKSSDSTSQSEKGNLNMMMQSNQPDHQRDLMNRHGSEPSADRSSQMQQDLLNRHASDSSDSTSQSEKGNINMMMQSGHPDHQRELLNRHSSEPSADRSLQMQQTHGDSHLMNRHSSESHRSMNNPVPLIRMHNNNRVSQGGGSGLQQGSSNRPMMPHHHHMGGAQNSEQIMPCLHPVPSKQY